MTRHGSQDLYLNSQFLEDTRSFEHEIGQLGEKLDDATAAFLARFIVSLGQPGERPLLGFCPVLQDKFRSITERGWRTLHDRAEMRNRMPWIIGYAENMDTFRRVYQLAWNSANNEPVVVVLAPEADSGDTFVEVEKAEGLYPGREERLLSGYPTVVSRYYDGLWLRVLSRRLRPEDAAECLDEARSDTSV